MSGEKQKKLSGYQNLLKKRKREEDVITHNCKITQFFQKPENTQADAAGTNSASTPQLPLELSKEPSNQNELEAVSIRELPSTSIESFEESEAMVKSTNATVCAYLPVPDDPGLWPSALLPSQVQAVIDNGPGYYQNLVSNFNYPKDNNGRKFSKINFCRTLPNNERVKRDWLLYSVKKNSVYCFCCKIFSDFSNAKLSTCGFNDWNHLSEHLKLHEKSKIHFRNLHLWSDLLERLRKDKTVDSEFQNLLKRETKHWRDVIERIIYSIQFLAEQNLAFRGSSNKLFERNNGNFLKCIEMISRFDPIMSAHINRAQTQKNMPHYLGDKIQNETISLLGDNIKQIILSKVKQAKYFSILLDCTPDASHQEQISVCIRYLNLENAEVVVEERFLVFCPTTDTTGEGLTTFLLNILKENGLDVCNLRGQGYDNGSNMRGKHSGVQKRILDINPRAFFVPCCNHSLNLVVNDAANNNLFGTKFFSTVQELYNFFSASTNRWSVLKKHVSSLTLKPLSDTRWSSRIDAITPLKFQLGEVFDALYEITEMKIDNTIKHQATSLGKKILKFDFICMVVLWYKLLSKVHVVSNILQARSFNISQASESLNTYVKLLSERIQIR